MDDTGFVSGSALYREQEDSEQDQASQVPVASSSKQQAKIGAYFGQVEVKRPELKKRKYPPLKPSDCRRYVIESLQKDAKLIRVRSQDTHERLFLSQDESTQS